jgi:ATP-dependent exoDNAse (exonuclease V) beta subunit
MALQREGLWGENLAAAQREVLSSVRQSLRADGAGRWVLATEHIDARSEWALTLVDAQGRIRDIIIDRTFVDSATGERWVIDYKNTCPAPDEPMAAFLKRQSDTYLDQLQCYRDAVRHLGQEPLRCALFFTALGQLHAIPDLDLPAATTGPNSCHS